MEKALRFVWFWTFWRWSKESSHAGHLLRDPLTGIGSHWDDWFSHEAAEEDRLTIEETGRTRNGQNQFVAWLSRHWAREQNTRGNRLTPRFVLGQLAHVHPFAEWPALERYRTTYGASGISAVTSTSPTDDAMMEVHSVETLLLSAGGPAARAKSTLEEFRASDHALSAPRQLTENILSGKVQGFFYLWWVFRGRRPYPRWLSACLASGWCLVAAFILSLLVGPDPGNRLATYCTILLSVWSVLVLTSLGMLSREAMHLWREGKALTNYLAGCLTRFRVAGNPPAQWEDAELAFTLNTLLALYRAQPGKLRSWIWRQLFHTMDREAETWAARGSVTVNGRIKSTEPEDASRACNQSKRIRHLLISPGRTNSKLNPGNTKLHPCRHIAQALLAIGGLASKSHSAMNIFTVITSIAVLASLPDLRNVIFPAPPPLAITPASSSLYYLWASLDTRDPEQFQVMLESRYWTNRRVNVVAHSGANASNRAEIPLIHLSHPTTTTPDDGTVWVERRRRFLFREFSPGERVGQYSFSYLENLGHE